MNTTKTRRRAALTALALTLFLLAGCAGEKAPAPIQPPDSAPEPSQAAEPAAALKPASEPTPAGEPDSSPESAVEPVPSPEPVIEPALSPAPAEEPSPSPEPAAAPEPTPAPQGPEDGNYTANVTLAGGSGRASVQSPAALRCSGGQFYASIVWSSPNFDYMKVDGVRYEPVSAPGENAAFEIPVAAFDQALPVIADTVAMSEPHEVEYTLTFDSATLARQ